MIFRGSCRVIRARRLKNGRLVRFEALHWLYIRHRPDHQAKCMDCRKRLVKTVGCFIRRRVWEALVGPYAAGNEVCGRCLAKRARRPITRSDLALWPTEGGTFTCSSTVG